MKQSVTRFSALFALLFILVNGIHAEGETLSSRAENQKQPAVQMPAIYFVKAQALKQGKLSIRSYYLRPVMTKMYNPATGTMVNIPVTMDFHFNSAILFVSYGLTDDITLGINGKYLFNSIINPPVEKYGVGLGDTEALIKYQFYKNQAVKLSAALNVVFPTGNPSESPSTLALGNGSYDFSFRFLSDWNIFHTVLTASLFYTLQGVNSFSLLDYGDSVRIILTEAIPLTDSIFIELVANYEHGFEDRNNLGIISGSATDYLSFSLGLQYQFNRNLSLQGLYEYSPWGVDKFLKGHIFKAGLSLSI